MKKLFISLLMLISIISYAGPSEPGEKVSPRLTAALEKEFTGAQYVVWQSLKERELFRAHFIYNNERLNAFFDEDGQLIAIGRNIQQAALPLSIARQLASSYSKFSVQDLIEYSRNGETSYVITLESDKQRITLEAFGSGNIYLFKKEKKNLPARV